MTSGRLAQSAAAPIPARLPPLEALAPAWRPPRVIEARLAEVEQQLSRQLSNSAFPYVNRVSGHLYAAGGKRLRPAMVLMAAALGDGSNPAAVKSAVAVELLHLATLYHDDIMDGADKRRGRPSVNRLWGNRVAAIGGSYLFALAISAFAALGRETNQWASEAAAELWQGQIRESELAFNTDIDVDQYFAHIGGKTASMFVLSCRLGAMHGGLGAAEIRALASYGQKLGLAFQVTDDVLDITGDSSSLGKPQKLDLGEGRIHSAHDLVFAGSRLRGRAARAARSPCPWRRRSRRGRGADQCQRRAR